MSKTAVKPKIDDIAHLNFNLACDYMNCDDKATHRLICPICSQFEFMCDPHAKAAIEAPKDSWIVFDKSCKHRVDLRDCRKESI